jgi:hypothetical protein
VPRFRVVLPDQSYDEWGVDVDAAYEVERSGNLRVVEFDPAPDGLHHARTAKLYGYDDWVDVQVTTSE